MTKISKLTQVRIRINRKSLPEHQIRKFEDKISGRGVDLGPLAVDGQEGRQTDSKSVNIQRIGDPNLHFFNSQKSINQIKTLFPINI